MSIINILDKQTANMIAAGEVVDRPSGALKELMENSLDAGATVIKVEITGGGRGMIRVVDNGCGIMREDVPKALLRHATSKINCGDDLAAVRTLGFRGEALAAISAVSKTEIVTCHTDETLGTKLLSDGDGVVMSDVGCPKGTAITVRELFYNTPARALFMKKDSTEASSCASVAEKVALSHPEVAVSFTNEGETKFSTPGDGKLFSAIHCVFGSAVAKTLTSAEYSLNGIAVSGFINTPDNPRGSRLMQVFFVNGRFVRSKTVTAALEEAFKSFIPPGKFPAAILNITLDFTQTDVNVHPAKLEIRFADERRIFEAVYYCVKNALTEKAPPEPAGEAFAEALPKRDFAYHSPSYPSVPLQPKAKQSGSVAGYEIFSASAVDTDTFDMGDGNVKLQSPPIPQETEFVQLSAEPEKEFRLIGEAYRTYIFAELSDKILIIDKHAAHERILYEQLAKSKTVSSQQLLDGITVNLSRQQISVLSENLSYLSQFGFEAELFGDDSLIIRAVPVSLSKIGKIDGILEEFASELASGSSVPFAEKVDRALFTVACKAAVKAHMQTSEADNEWIVGQMLSNPSLRFCPHGRPVCREMAKRDIEKFFDR